MTGDVVKYPGGGGMIIDRVRRAPSCSACGRSGANIQCDFETGTGKKCDKWLCLMCAVQVGKGRDYCPSHLELKKSESAITVIGLLVAIGIFTLILCGLLYTGGKLLNAGATIQARRDAMLTNDLAKVSGPNTQERDEVIERLLTLPTQVFAPAADEMTDADFLAWADSVQTWAVLYREHWGDEWTDTGNRLYGASEDVGVLLRDLCHWESVYAAAGATKDGRKRETGFYGWCGVEELPERKEEK